MTIGDGIKKYFTSKPKGDFWMWACITLFIFRFATPTVATIMVFMQMGLVAPDINITPTAERVGEELAHTFMDLNIGFYEIGQGIALKNPRIAKILFYAYSSFVWSIWIALIGLIIQFIRMGIAYGIEKYKKVPRRHNNGGLI